MNAVLAYLRVSTQGQADNGVSLDAQLSKIRGWAELNGAVDVRIFRDEGISGKRSDNRPGLQAALDAVGNGDALVVHSLSRLSRSIRDTLDIAELLQKRDADLVSLSEKIDTTSATGKMVFHLLAVLAEFERDQISERTKAALRYKKSRGEKIGSCAPYGFRAEGRMLVKVPEETAVIKRVRGWRRDGLSLRAIARRLESRSIRRKAGGSTWCATSVSRVLRMTA